MHVHVQHKLLRHGWYLDTNLSERLLLWLRQLLGMKRDEPKTRSTILVVVDQLEWGYFNYKYSTALLYFYEDQR